MFVFVKRKPSQIKFETAFESYKFTNYFLAKKAICNLNRSFQDPYPRTT